MHVPHIKLQITYDKTTSLGDINLLALGYAIHQAWIYATLVAGSDLFGVAEHPLHLFGATTTFVYLISILAFGICLIASAYFDSRMLGLVTSKRVLIAAAFVESIGTLLLAIPLEQTSLLLATEILAALATGIGSALLILFWGTAFARCDTSSIALNSVLAIAFAFIIYALVLHKLPYPASAGVCILMPFLELAILWVKTPVSFLKRGDRAQFNILPISKRSFLVRFGIPVLILGCALGMIRQTSIRLILPATESLQQGFITLAACVVVVSIFIVVMIIGKVGTWNNLFRPLVPLIATSLVLLLLPSGEEMSIGCFFLLVSYMCFEALMWAFFGELSHRFRLSPTLVYGLGRGLLAFGAIVGLLLQSATASSTETTGIVGQMPVMILLVVLFVAYALLPSEKSIAQSIAPCPLVVMVSAIVEDDLPLSEAYFMPKRQDGKGRASRQEDSRGQAESQSASTQAQDRRVPQTEISAIKNTAGSGTAVDFTNAALGSNEKTDAAQPQATSNLRQTSDSFGMPRADNAADTYTKRTAGAAVPGTQSAATRTTKTAISNARTERGERSATGVAAPELLTRATMTPNTPTALGAGNTTLSGIQARAAAAAPGTSFQEKCDAVARTFLLSPRETDVFCLLAKGYSNARIQEKLFISEGTTKTHIRHIYRKIDVHSQQELIRLVESF